MLSCPDSISRGFFAALVCLPLAQAAVHIDFGVIDHAGNAADSAVMEVDGTSGYGSVTGVYRIARTETTVAQYTTFLNAVAATDTYGLYHPDMGLPALAGITRSGESGAYHYQAAAENADKPVTFVSWFDAARFCNWLHNGQKSGTQDATTTEDGAYGLHGATSGTNIARKAGATVWLPSEDEWYKAAYYDPEKNGGSGGYWSFPNRGDTVGGNTVGEPGALNFFDGDYTGWPDAALTVVGQYGPGSASAFGIHDMGGNVFEWNEAVIGNSRGVRGGSWDFPEEYLAATNRDDFDPADRSHNIGFRVAGTAAGAPAVPEPACVLPALCALAGLLLRHRRR